MKLPTVTNCCCCLSLRTAGLVIGAFGVLANMIGVLSGYAMVLNGELTFSIHFPSSSNILCGKWRRHDVARIPLAVNLHCYGVMSYDVISWEFLLRYKNKNKFFGKWLFSTELVCCSFLNTFFRRTQFTTKFVEFLFKNLLNLSLYSFDSLSPVSCPFTISQ